MTMAKKSSKRVASYDAKSNKPVAITQVEYGGLQTAFDFLNARLFEGALPDVLLTFQRKARAGGYFAAERFAQRGGARREHEIALNPDGFVGRNDRHIVSVLLHEQVHLWQFLFGKRPKRHYHDKQWAEKMQAVGLMPSSTGMVGGRITGASMSHYVIDDGPFSQAFAELAATGWKLNLESAKRPGEVRAPNSKVKSTCPQCGGNGWAKPDFRLGCIACGVEMISERPAVRSYEQEAA
jgi:hypothetical protein